MNSKNVVMELKDRRNLPVKHIKGKHIEANLANRLVGMGEVVGARKEITSLLSDSVIFAGDNLKKCTVSELKVVCRERNRLMRDKK